MCSGTLAHAEAHERREDEVVLLVADEDESFRNVIRELPEAFHSCGTGSIETRDVDCDVSLEV